MARGSTTIGAPNDRKRAVEEFLRGEGIDWIVVDPPGGQINIIEAEKGAECDFARLHPGGRIPCAVALSLAEALEVPSKAVGRLMNLLEIRIYDCQLGCFK